MFHTHALKEYLNLCNRINKCSCIKYVLSHANYQHVSIAFATIIRAALQMYRRTPVSLGNTFQDLLQLRETTDNTERYT